MRRRVVLCLWVCSDRSRRRRWWWWWRGKALVEGISYFTAPRRILRGPIVRIPPHALISVGEVLVHDNGSRRARVGGVGQTIGFIVGSCHAREAHSPKPPDLDVVGKAHSSFWGGISGF